MGNWFIQYWKLVKKGRKKYHPFLMIFLPLLLTIITGIYINLFTNQPSLQEFWGLKLNVSGDVVFMLAFGLVSLISLIKGLISMGIMALLILIIGFFLYLIDRLHTKLLSMIRINSILIILSLIMGIELILAIVIFIWTGSFGTAEVNTKYIIKFLVGVALVFFGINTAQVIEKILKQRARRFNRRVIRGRV